MQDTSDSHYFANLFWTLQDAGYEFDVCYTSVLKRAIKTLWLVLDSIDQMWVPVYRTWRLNERHYGGLTGLNKAETAAMHGDAQVKIWRRSFDIPPPTMDPDHDFYTVISKVRHLLYYNERNLCVSVYLWDYIGIIGNNYFANQARFRFNSCRFQNPKMCSPTFDVVWICALRSTL